MTAIGAPVLCAVNGACVGGGAELVCFADLVIAADTATFCYNGTKVGGCSWWGAPQLLPLMVGLRRAEEILYLSATLTAAQALEYGLVNRVVPAGQLRGATAELADQLLGLSAEGMRQTKAALRPVRELMLLSMSSAAEQNASAVAGPDIQQAFQAFLDKETIDWRSTRPGLIETSLLGWMTNLQAVGAQIAANTGQNPRPSRREDANDPLYNYYRCRDGVWVALGMVIHKEMFWPKVCAALGQPGLAADPRFDTADKREQNCRELVQILDGLFAELDFADWEKLAVEQDFISTRVNELTDLAGDPQVQANGYFERRPHPVLGEWTYVATPLEFSQTPLSIRGCAP